MSKQHQHQAHIGPRSAVMILKKIFGEIDDVIIIEILALKPTLAEHEEAAVYRMVTATSSRRATIRLPASQRISSISSLPTKKRLRQFTRHYQRTNKFNVWRLLRGGSTKLDVCQELQTARS